MPTTTTLYPTTVAGTTGSTWTTTTNATGSGTGTTSAAWAVFTNGTNGGSGGTGTIQLSGYAAQVAGPSSTDTITSVVLSLRGNVATVARWTAASCTAQLFSGTTAIGTPVAIGTLSTTTTNVWTITFTGANAPTYAQLADLRVQVTAVHAGTTSSTFNVDTAGLVVGYVTPGPKFETLVDTFDTLDTGKWSVKTGTTGTVAVSGGRLAINTGSTNDYPELASITGCDLTGSSFYAQISSLAPSAGTTEATLGLRLDVNNFVSWIIDGNGFLQYRIITGGATTSTNVGTYSEGTHGTWFRISESGGTVTFSSSIDAVTWTVRGTVSPSWSMVSLTAFLSAGHWSAEASGTTTFDNVNTDGVSLVPAELLPLTETFTGANGDGWSSRWTTATSGGTVDIQSNAGRLVSMSTAAFGYGNKAYLSSMAARRDTDLTLDVTFPDVTGEQYLHVALRSPDGGPSGPPANAYYLRIAPAANAIDVVKVVAGTQTNIVGALSCSWAAGVRQRIRFSAIADTLSLRVWNPAGAEPSTWLWTGTDTALTTTIGRVWLSTACGGTPAARTALIDNVTVSGAPSAAALAAWRSALAGQATAPATWLHIGDSIGEGQGASTRANRWVDVALGQVRSMAGVVGGGVGYLPAWYAVYGPDSAWQPYSSRTGTITNESTGPSWGERNISFGAGASQTWTVSGTHADLWWITGGGTFSWAVDGGTATTADTAGTLHGNNRTRITFAASGSHTVTVTGVTGTSRVSGLTVFNADRDSGVQLYDSSHTSWKSSDFTDGTQFTELPGMVTLADPDLVTISLGTNDPGVLTAAQTKANVVSLIGQVRSGKPGVAVVVVVMYAYSSSVTWQPYADALRAIATDDPTVGILDFFATMSTATSSGYWRSDALHPSDTGHAYMGQQAAAYLAPTSTATTTAQGVASGTWTFAGTAAGKRTAKATGSGSWTFTGTAVGKRAAKATASGSWTFAGGATGKRTPKAIGSGSWSFVGSGTGATVRRGTGSGLATWTGAGSGLAPTVGINDGSGTGAWAFVGTGAGRRAPIGSGSGLAVWTGSGAGIAPVIGGDTYTPHVYVTATLTGNGVSTATLATNGTVTAVLAGNGTSTAVLLDNAGTATLQTT